MPRRGSRRALRPRGDGLPLPDRDRDPDPLPGQDLRGPQLSLPAGTRVGLGWALLRALLPGISADGCRQTGATQRCNPSTSGLQDAGCEGRTGRRRRSAQSRKKLNRRLQEPRSSAIAAARARVVWGLPGDVAKPTAGPAHAPPRPGPATPPAPPPARAGAARAGTQAAWGEPGAAGEGA